MTDTYVQAKLETAFMTLNTFSGKSFIKFDDSDKPTNVSVANRDFTPPTGNQFFVLNFLPDTPEPVAMGTDAGNRWTGVFQIDVCTPLNKGEAEAYDKYEWLSKLFNRGKYFDEVLIQNCYRATARPDESHYTTVIRVEWTAALER